MIVKDLNNKEHDACPRCGCLWSVDSSPDEVYCSNYTNCGLIAAPCYDLEVGDCYLLSVIFVNNDKRYYVDWGDGNCFFGEMTEGYVGDTKLPGLSYNITWDKLKLYLLFS